MSGKIEKADKSSKLTRDKSKGSKDRDSPPELNFDGLRGEGDSVKSISPRGGKKKRAEIVSSIGSPGVRFETQEERLAHREKISSRSSSAGPLIGGDPRSTRETEDADTLLLMFHDFVGQMTPSINNIVRRNLELKAQVTSMLKAAQVEEAPFMALARDKENLSREYDALRYERQILQQELEQLKRDNALLIVENQQLQAENRRLRRKSGSVSSGSASIPNVEPPVLTSNGNGGSSSSIGAGYSSNLAQTPPTRLKRRDNVAELEQSILDLEEEIRSPRGILGSPISASPEITRDSTPTKSKKKITKSLSSDPQNTHSIVTSSSSAGISPSPSSTRAKAPPERVVSAPDQVKSTISASSSNPTTPPISAHNIVRQEARLVQNAVVLNPSAPPSVAPAGAAAASQRPASTAEDREEQRLAKYLSGGTRRSTPNMLTKNQLSGSKGTLPTTLTIAEQAAFSQLFRKWDIRSDDQIERHELEIVLDQMASNEVLKELWTSALPYLVKINWESLGISKSSTITLNSALSFLTDCKAGVAQPSILASKS